MRDDLRAAFRGLRSSKTFTIVALSVLALGIGASTAIFSVVDAVVLRGLPFDEHDRLVAVGQRTVPSKRSAGQAADPQAVSTFAPQNYTDLAAQQRVFESIAAIAGAAITLREPGAEPEEIRAQKVTAAFFGVLRQPPAIGHAFGVENETDGQDHVAIISDGLWHRRFGADPAIVGRTIPLDAGRVRRRRRDAAGLRISGRRATTDGDLGAATSWRRTSGFAIRIHSATTCRASRA